MRISYLFILIFSVQLSYGAHISFPFLKSTVEIVDSAEAAILLGKDDGYASKFSRFDAEGRMGKGADFRLYLPFAMKQTQNWNTEEQASLKKGFGEIEAYFEKQSINLNLPEKIYLIKSTTKEEFGAEGYTRMNCIILNTEVGPINTNLIAHELFHVFSRHNEKKRDELYAVFGFKKCNPIELNDAINNRNITNPDCPVISHYLTINNEDVTLLLYSYKNYEGGNVFQEYIRIGLVVLEGTAKQKKVKRLNGQPIIRELESTPQIFDLVGTNTAYLLHPEEICADHFVMMINGRKVKQPEFVVRFKKILKK